MANEESELYFVFMNYDPEYERLRSKRSVFLLYFTYKFFIKRTLK